MLISDKKYFDRNFIWEIVLDLLNCFSYNSIVILSYFFLALILLFINKITGGKSNKVLFSSYRSSIFNPLTYVRLFTHVLGHENWSHFINNFLYILLIGPVLEEKYGSLNLMLLILITALVTGIVNSILGSKRILGSSGIVFMLIILSSFVNMESGKVPVTLILICIFYVINEVVLGVFKKDRISHLSHVIGAIMGCIYGFFLFMN